MSLITYLTEIEFGAGSISELGKYLDRFGVQRPLVISDHGIKAAGLLDKVVRQLKAEAPVFLDVPTNPTEAATVAAVEVYVANNCDGLVAIGGGSPIDLAKGVALLATHGGSLAKYALIEDGMQAITGKVAPVIAIPTTAGTGAEVGRAALITLEDGRKLGFVSTYLIPKCAICDPMLTLGLPQWLTAATALDALSHCFETYLSPRYNPPAEAIALDGAARIWNNIVTAYEDGTNLDARTELMMGSLQGGLTFQKGLGAIHALSHALGGLRELQLHHGTLNAIFLPSVMQINRDAVPEKIRCIETALKIQEGGLPTALAELKTQLGIPKGLRSLGVRESHFDYIVERAIADHSHVTNPLQLTADQYRQLIKENMI
ncbi:iron-containing alcohol dehydrogenase [Halomonas sp. AOP5-CZ2-32]